MQALQSLAAVIAAFVMTTQPATALSIPERFQPVIAAVGWQPADIPDLAYVISCESSWDSLAVGAAGEIGLLQITFDTWQDMRKTHPDVPQYEHVWNPASQLYTGRVIFEESGWRRWSCKP